MCSTILPRRHGVNLCHAKPVALPITVTGAGTLHAAVAYSTDNWATFTYLTPSWQRRRSHQRHHCR